MPGDYRTKIKVLLKEYFVPSIDAAMLKRKRLARYFLSNAGLTLDVGFGSGLFSFLACKKGNIVTGISINPDDVKNCERYRDEMGIDPSRLQFKALNVYNVLDLEHEFDQIICFEVIEHIKDDKRFMALLSKILKPGGVIHITTPNIDGPDLFGDAIDEEELGGHVRKGYDYEGLNEIIAGAGLTILKKDSYGSFFTVKAVELMRVVEKIMANVFKINCKTIKVITFLFIYPFTFLDPLVPCKPFSLYVMAGKPK